MSKKKIISLCLVVCLLATAIGGTLAYFTDTEKATNTMTLGTVSIEQLEQQRGENGLEDFTQNQTIYPAVGTIAWNDEKTTINGHQFNMFGDKLKNVVDKIVSVKNTGDNPAYVRTIIAIEDPFTINAISINANDTNGVTQTNPKWITVEIGGTTYSVTAFTYNEALGKGQTTVPSLLQAYLKSVVTEEDCAALNGTWEILALSQAVQTAGWEATEGKTVAQTALDTAFGEVNAANVAEWFK